MFEGDNDKLVERSGLVKSTTMIFISRMGIDDADLSDSGDDSVSGADKVSPVNTIQPPVSSSVAEGNKVAFFT